MRGESGGGELHYANITNIPACDIGGKKFLLHGHRASAALKDGRIKITHPSSGAIDEARYTVVDVDMIGYAAWRGEEDKRGAPDLRGKSKIKLSQISWWKMGDKPESAGLSLRHLCQLRI